MREDDEDLDFEDKYERELQFAGIPIDRTELKRDLTLILQSWKFWVSLIPVAFWIIATFYILNLDVHQILDPIPQMPQVGSGIFQQADYNSPLFWPQFKLLLYHLFAFLGIMLTWFYTVANYRVINLMSHFTGKTVDNILEKKKTSREAS